MGNPQRIALVTGGMGGLGEAICIKLAALGDAVITTYSPSNTQSQEWLRTMRARGLDFHAYACDLTDWESCQARVRFVTTEIGPVDVLVNNAGITRDMTFKKMDKINWDAVMHANRDSCFYMAKQVCEGMVDRGWGRIITSRRSTVRKAHSGKRITQRLKPVCTALQRHSPWRWPVRA